MSKIVFSLQKDSKTHNYSIQITTTRRSRIRILPGLYSLMVKIQVGDLRHSTKFRDTHLNIQST